jgi:hypothetical protein
MQTTMTAVASVVLTGVQETADGDAADLRGAVVLLLIFGWIGAFAAQLIRSRRRQRRTAGTETVGQEAG